MSEPFFTEDELEKCNHCGELLLEENCPCQEDPDDNSYNARLKRGFDMLDMD